MKNKRLSIILIIAAVLLLLPLIAMQFTSEVNWTSFDFIVAGILLMGTGLTLELLIRKVNKKGLRIALILFLFAIFFLTWAELAVGIFGTPLAGN